MVSTGMHAVAFAVDDGSLWCLKCLAKSVGIVFTLRWNRRWVAGKSQTRIEDNLGIQLQLENFSDSKGGVRCERFGNEIFAWKCNQRNGVFNNFEFVSLLEQKHVQGVDWNRSMAHRRCGEQLLNPTFQFTNGFRKLIMWKCLCV